MLYNAFDTTTLATVVTKQTVDGMNLDQAAQTMSDVMDGGPMRGARAVHNRIVQLESMPTRGGPTALISVMTRVGHDWDTW